MDGYLMLVLSRKTGERITIGDDTVVLIQSVARGRVRVAIQAPRKTKILRGELSAFGVTNVVARRQRPAPQELRAVAGAIDG